MTHKQMSRKGGAIGGTSRSPEKIEAARANIRKALAERARLALVRRSEHSATKEGRLTPSETISA